MERNIKEASGSYQGDRFVFDNFDISRLSDKLISQYSILPLFEGTADAFMVPVHLQVNQGSFTIHSGILTFSTVTIIQQDDQLILSCDCSHTGPTLCEHQSQVLYSISRQDDLKLFFDEKLRHQRLKDIAMDFGLENERDPEQFFQIAYKDNKPVITPKFPSLMPVTPESLYSLEALLLPA